MKRWQNIPVPDQSARSYLWLAARFVGLIAVIILATWVARDIRDGLSMDITSSDEDNMRRAIFLGLLAYIVLLAIPFVPGAEIGIVLLTSLGAMIAPYVYGATVISMMLAYALGLLLPTLLLVRMLTFLRLRKAADLIGRVAATDPKDRMDLLLQSAPPRLIKLILRHRYLALAIALNVPGNVVIGGGGGIMIVAGMTGIFAPLPTLIAILIGVCPVPLAVMAFGA